MTIISYYRQLTLPVTPTDTKCNRQTYRYERAIKIFEKILKDNNDIIIVGDNYNDTLKDNNKFNNNSNHELKDMRE